MNSKRNLRRFYGFILLILFESHSLTAGFASTNFDPEDLIHNINWSTPVINCRPCTSLGSKLNLLSLFWPVKKFRDILKIAR